MFSLFLLLAHYCKCSQKENNEECSVDHVVVKTNHHINCTFKFSVVTSYPHVGSASVCPTGSS